MTTAYYFAYGSNMLTERLKARVPSCRPVGMAWLQGRRLCFSKPSKDGSGKCDIGQAAESDRVAGVVFTMDCAELALLDRAEGRGYGYDRIQTAVSLDGESLRCYTYVATSVNPALRPYDWYKELVLAGARQHGLPAAYIIQIEAVAAIPDPELDRQSRLEALQLLADSFTPVGPNEGDVSC